MIHTLLDLALVGLLVWAVLQIPMPEIFKTVITVVAVIWVILWLIELIGFADIPMPRLRH